MNLLWVFLAAFTGALLGTVAGMLLNRFNDWLESFGKKKDDDA